MPERRQLAIGAISTRGANRIGAAVLLLALGLSSSAAAVEKPRLFVDADTANEIDDLFAIVRLLNQERFEVVALASCQWEHYLAGSMIGTEESTVEASQRFNEELLDLLGRTDLPHPIGSQEPVGKPWGGAEPKDSPAARAIIAAVAETPPGEKLNVLCLGAVTNVASALAIEPAIADRVRVYLLGFEIDAERVVWNKSTFNTRRDLNGADLLLDTPGVELHVMPTNAAESLVYERADTWRRLRGMGPLGAYLRDKWAARFADFDTWIMWDVALAEAMINPALAETRVIAGPPENTARRVTVYTRINASAMRDSYWAAVRGRPVREP